MADEVNFTDELSVRPVSAEEAFSRQNDRIAYLRSYGEDWEEAVNELRDQLEGLEDAEFWDGIPPEVREGLDDLTVKEREEVVDHYAERGWLTMRVRAYPGRKADGSPDWERPIYVPTADQLSRRLRIIRALATRRGITWRTKRRSWLGYESEAEFLGKP